MWDKLLRRELTARRRATREFPREKDSPKKRSDFNAAAFVTTQAPHEPFVNFEEDTSNFDEYPDSKEETSLPDYGGEPDPFADFA